MFESSGEHVLDSIDIIEEANAATLNLLPNKSRKRYEKEHDLFSAWRKKKNVKGVSENIVLAYFSEKAKIMKSSTLWSHYSMLKATLIVKEDVNITKFARLTAFLKRQSSGYKAKKSNTFSREEINKFLMEAPDDNYLMLKVALIMGIAGACRRDELQKMSVDDIQDKGSILVVILPDTKTKNQRIFTVTDAAGSINPIEVYRKYASLRPENIDHKRFFIYYKSKKCTVQPVGVNTFAKMPKVIAEYLKLPNPKEYTGHSFRRSSASLLANAGADLLSLKRHGGWKSATVAEGYIDDSIGNKVKIAKKILDNDEVTRAATREIAVESSEGIHKKTIDLPSESGININSITGCTINFNVVNNCK